MREFRECGNDSVVLNRYAMGGAMGFEGPARGRAWSGRKVKAVGEECWWRGWQGGLRREGAG
jgi:hypothetical protein